MPSRPSRRAVVAAALTVPAASAAGCSLSGPAPERTPAARSEDVDPDVALLDRVAGSTASMVALYEGVVQRHRALRRDLRPLLAAHRAHAAALGEAAPSSATPGGAASGRSGAQNPAAGDVEVPGSRARAVRRLREAEREESGRLLEATGAATSGPFARLLASMSAASAQHVQVLRGVDR